MASLFESFANFGSTVLGNNAQFKAMGEIQRLNNEDFDASIRTEDMNAVETLIRGAVMAGRLRSKSSQLIAKQRLAYVGSGVDAAVGTPLDVAGSTALTTELDAQTLMNDAVRAAWGHKQMSTRLGRQKQVSVLQHQAQVDGLLAQNGAAGAQMAASFFDTFLTGGGGMGGAMGGGGGASSGGRNNKKG